MIFDEMDKKQIADLTNYFYTGILDECKYWYGKEGEENIPFMVKEIIKNLNTRIDN